MKKRIASIFLVTALVVASVIGLSACSVSMPKGDEVTAEQWESAFDKTSEVTNYTMEMSASVGVTVSGTTSSYNYSTEKTTTKEVKSSVKMSGNQTVLYDKEGKKAYSEYSATSKTTAEVDGEKENSSAKEVAKNYYEFSEKKTSYGSDYDYYWRAGYALSESRSTDSRKVQESYWDAYETSSFAYNDISNMFSGTYFYEKKDDENAMPKSLSNLYDKFTFDGGVYTATLYSRVNIYGSAYEYLECTIKVSINKAENCVTGISIKTSGEGNATEKDKYNLDYKYSGESVYSITGIKNTDPAKKLSGDITKALNKAKAEKEKEKDNA